MFKFLSRVPSKYTVSSPPGIAMTLIDSPSSNIPTTEGANKSSVLTKSFNRQMKSNSFSFVPFISLPSPSLVPKNECELLLLFHPNVVLFPEWCIVELDNRLFQHVRRIEL